MLPPQKPTASEQQIVSLGRVLQSLREENNVDVLIETTISYLKEQFDYSLIWIALYDQLNHILLGKGGITPIKDTSYLRQRVALHPGDLLEQVVIEQRSLGVADLRTEIHAQRWQEVAVKSNIQGTMVLPICYKGCCLGVVLLGSERWGYILGGEAKARLMMVLGELGAVLFQIKMDLQHKQAKRLDEPLLQLLENLQTLSNLEQKLEAVVHTTHQFVSPTRTSIYWFEREKRSFWLRLSNQKLNKAKANSDTQGVAGISVQELSDFYYALSVNQIVLIGEGRSSLTSTFTAKLLQRLQVRSLLAAPIIWQKNLLGFVAVEAKEARIWTEADQNFVKGAAGLISLVTPTESMETTIKQIQEDSQLNSQVAQAIYSDYDNIEILRICATKVLERFNATRFLLLHYDSDQNNYHFLYQRQLQNRRPLASTLEALKDLDWQLLQRSTDSVGIENIEEDLRFFNWRSPLQENGVQSLLISNCAQGRPPEALLLITNEEHRCWTVQEKELLHIVSQQIGVIVRQWHLHHQTEQQQKILRSFQQCLRILEKARTAHTQPIQELESSALEQIASVLGCPLVLLLSWMPEQNLAEIIPGVIADDRFGVVMDIPVPIQTESLVQWALATDGLLTLSVDDLPEQTRRWLNGSDIGQILIMALRTSADYQPTGIVVMADRVERQWSEQSLIAIETLIRQFAWFRRHLQITQVFESTTDKLRQLNWYKHHRVEDIHRTLVQLVTQMYSLGIPNELAHTRYQQLLYQLDNITASMTALLKLEQWQLHITTQTIPIASLLKRSLERVENLLKQHKLWVGVHGLGQQVLDHGGQKSDPIVPNSSEGLKPQAMAIAGDIAKIELVVYELLVAACHRSTTGGRIDIWCRRLNERSLEMSITDNGNLDPQILTLNQDPQKDFLAPSSLNLSPELHLLICQNFIQQLGGELHFYQLPDHRVVSRLLLPLVW
ncbi:GAF domain-containing protein [Mastigocladopsis repens]|uniref:GAF domain-containing protein n=1 Tax=Mastigocladopsis repens TaxID=221287 RepID=UPI0002FB5F3F|nr:GAF domain-containing protein [Mastigocladopsis repens]